MYSAFFAVVSRTKRWSHPQAVTARSARGRGGLPPRPQSSPAVPSTACAEHSVNTENAADAATSWWWQQAEGTAASAAQRPQRPATARERMYVQRTFAYKALKNKDTLHKKHYIIRTLCI